MLHLFKTNTLEFIVVPYLMPLLSKVQRCNLSATVSGIGFENQGPQNKAGGALPQAPP
jgi:hypothetical protein